MNLLSEEIRETLVNSLTGIITWSGYTTSGVYQWTEDTQRRDPQVYVSFLPTSRKYAQGFDHWLSYRTNTNYSNYGYGEEEAVVIRAWAKDSGLMKGKRIAYNWLKTIETFIKVQWNNLISNGSIDRGSFGPYKMLPNDYSKKQYGYEMSFYVSTMNSWTDEPASGAKSCYPVSGVEISGFGYTQLED